MKIEYNARNLWFIMYSLATLYKTVRFKCQVISGSGVGVQPSLFATTGP